jgi:hypothetical protein
VPEQSLRAWYAIKVVLGFTFFIKELDLRVLNLFIFGLYPQDHLKTHLKRRDNTQKLQGET